MLITDDERSYAVGASVLLRNRFGWGGDNRMTLDPSAFASRGTHVHSRAAVELSGDLSALGELAYMNSLDLQFHASARELFHDQLVQEIIADEQHSTDLSSAITVQDLDSVLRSGSLAPSQGGERARESLQRNAGADFTGGDEHGNVAASERFFDRYFDPIVSDRSGFGGHSERCRGLGGMHLNDCRKHLLESVRSGTACDTLSYKDGQCYLHSSKANDFWEGSSPGHKTQHLSGALKQDRSSGDSSNHKKAMSTHQSYKKVAANLRGLLPSHPPKTLTKGGASANV